MDGPRRSSTSSVDKEPEKQPEEEDEEVGRKSRARGLSTLGGNDEGIGKETKSLCNSWSIMIGQAE